MEMCPSRYGYMERTKSLPARPGRLVGSPARSENRGAPLQSVAMGTGVPSFRALQWEPGCPPSERCKGNRGAPLKSDARTRACRGSVWKRGHHCLLVADRSAYARRVRDEALTHLLNWNADICCCSLRRGPLRHDWRDHFNADRWLRPPVRGGPPVPSQSEYCVPLL